MNSKHNASKISDLESGQGKSGSALERVGPLGNGTHIRGQSNPELSQNGTKKDSGIFNPRSTGGDGNAKSTTND